jgi:LacI family transcriptional regulator
MGLEEVARRAGVSASTVSRVLNGISVVKDSTRERVLRAVAEVNYHPNLHARTLAGGKSRTLGMIVSNMENPFFFDVYRALETAAHQGGYEVLAANTGYSPEQLMKSIRLMIGRRVAGLAVIVSEMDPRLIEELSDSGIPAVFYDVGTPGKGISNIRVSYGKGIDRLVEHLRELGHRRMAFIGHHSTLGPTSERETAFVSSVRRRAPGAEWRTIANQDGPEGGRLAMRELLASGFRPTAVICVNDFVAIGALKEIRDQGLKVPEDVSVTGFDNILLSEYVSPPLTTVHIPREQIGRLVYETLAEESSRARLSGREVVIDPELVVRESTGRARSG